jgi:hypothetical protein
VLFQATRCFTWRRDNGDKPVSSAVSAQHGEHFSSHNAFSHNEFGFVQENQLIRAASIIAGLLVCTIVTQCALHGQHSGSRLRCKSIIRDTDIKSALTYATVPVFDDNVRVHCVGWNERGWTLLPVSTVAVDAVVEWCAYNEQR